MPRVLYTWYIFPHLELHRHAVDHDHLRHERRADMRNTTWHTGTTQKTKGTQDNTERNTGRSKITRGQNSTPERKQQAHAGGGRGEGRPEGRGRERGWGRGVSGLFFLSDSYYKKK